LAFWLTFPGIQAWWEVRPVNFSATFSEFVETSIRDNPTDRSATKRWQEFVSSKTLKSQEHR
jgi:hypothetical protein